MKRDEISSSLVQAVKAKDPTAVRRLIADGADVNAPDDGGATPLHYAACGMPEMVDLLYAHGADSRVKDRRGYMPLHVAYLRKDVECVRALAACGADIHAPIPGMRSPVEEARASGNLVMLEALGGEGPSSSS